ncbi:hypothetical protein JCM9279_001753 [Rhodotorula babjevae]
MASPLSPQGKATATTSLSARTATPPPPPPPPPADQPAADLAQQPPPPPPLHRAAQQGDLDAVYALLDHPRPDQPALTASDPDPQGITPLHWAAINGNALVAKALLDRGALVDARGGDLDATPAMWGARNGHLAVVHLLVQHGADLRLADQQGFSLLHLAVHSSSAFLLAYLLLSNLAGVDVDGPDPEGHTSLAWACYQGDAISVELLLACGADPTRTDAAGLTPLHWAVTKGNSACIRRIASAPGVDLHARTDDNKTAREMAIELKSHAAYARALADAGMSETGAQVDRPLGERNTQRAIFAVVAAALGVALELAALAPWYVGLLAVPAVAFGMHHVVVRVLLGVGAPGPAAAGAPKHGHGHAHGAGGGERVTKSPYLCAIIVASLGWVAWVWLSRYLTLHGYALSNLVFGVLIGSCSYALFKAVTLDPGSVRGPAVGSEGLKQVVEELVDAGAFNGMNFCLSCLVRRPLRSKHSYATERCVARFDHYCPWVWNDVGVSNHRQFLTFLITLVLGITSFLHVTYGYFYEKAPDLPPTASCPALSPTFLCMALHYDPFPVLVAFWAALQLTWTVILLGAQLYQVARQLTTLEQSNLGRYGYMGGKPGVSGAQQQGAVEKWTAAKQARHAAQLGDAGAGDGDDDPTSLAHAPATGASDDEGALSSARVPKGRMALLLRLLGLDRFLLSSPPRSSRARRSRTAPGTAPGAGANPFDLGLRANCADFWTAGAELGVRYDELWGVPDGGFARVVAERKRREEEERAGRGEGGAAGGAWDRVRGRRGSGAPAPARGYERVALDEV